MPAQHREKLFQVQHCSVLLKHSHEGCFYALALGSGDIYSCANRMATGSCLGCLLHRLFAATDPLGDELGNAFLPQSVIPTLVSSSGTQQQQQTATFCPQQFPDSWSAYLSRGTNLQPEQELLGRPEPSHEAIYGPTSALSLEEKQERIREKNRRAMKKFRAKQKVA